MTCFPLALLLTHDRLGAQEPHGGFLDLAIATTAFEGWGCFLLGDGGWVLKHPPAPVGERWGGFQYAEPGFWGVHAPSLRKRGIAASEVAAWQSRFPSLRLLEGPQFLEHLYRYRRILCLTRSPRDHPGATLC